MQRLYYVTKYIIFKKKKKYRISIFLDVYILKLVSLLKRYSRFKSLRVRYNRMRARRDICILTRGKTCARCLVKQEINVPHRINERCRSFFKRLVLMKLSILISLGRIRKFRSSGLEFFFSMSLMYSQESINDVRSYAIYRTINVKWRYTRDDSVPAPWLASLLIPIAFFWWVTMTRADILSLTFSKNCSFRLKWRKMTSMYLTSLREAVIIFLSSLSQSGRSERISLHQSKFYDVDLCTILRPSICIYMEHQKFQGKLRRPIARVIASQSERVARYNSRVPGRFSGFDYARSNSLVRFPFGTFKNKPWSRYTNYLSLSLCHTVHDKYLYACFFFRLSSDKIARKRFHGMCV